MRLSEKLAEKPEIGIAEDLFEVCRLVELDDFDLAHKANKQVRRESVAIGRKERSFRALDLNKKSLLFDAPHEFDSYMLFLEYDREPSKKFYVPRRKILLPVVADLQLLLERKLDLLTISTPPGVGKTTLAIFFLSLIMGKFPDEPNLASAHSDKLTRSIYDGVYSVLSDPEYLWGEVFPTAGAVGTNAKDETINIGYKKRFKSLTCRSIDGSLTGATRCERLLYSDDLVSGIEEALSRERMDTLWTKYSNDLKSRKKLDCGELHIATRWSVHDPIGRLERQYEGNDKCRFIKMPALDDNDQSNFNYDYGVGFDSKYFWDMRDTLDDISWRCLFQQEPIEREGLLYHEPDLRRYFELPSSVNNDGDIVTDDADVILAICDTAEGGGDDTFLPVAYLYGEDVYIEDCVCDPSLPEATIPLCAEKLVHHKVKQAQFESNAAGSGYADKVNEQVKKLGGHTHITKRRTTSNKLTKIIVNSAYVKSHFLFKDKSCYEPRSQYARMMNNLVTFTVTGKSKHDDVPDGMAQLAEYITGMRGGEVKILKRPF